MPIAGYISSKHLFGRSELVRQGTTYYLLWQTSTEHTPNDMITLTTKQYKEIKSMLGESIYQEIKPVTNLSNKLITHHMTDSKIYMRIKRYLKKYNLLKEKQHDRIETSSKEN